MTRLRTRNQTSTTAVERIKSQTRKHKMSTSHDKNNDTVALHRKKSVEPPAKVHTRKTRVKKTKGFYFH